MKTQNYTQLIGYLGNDPISRKAANGNKLARLRLATDHYRMDSTGNRQQRVTWHDVVVWGTMAEKAEEKFMKGAHLMIQGEIEYRTYVDARGHLRYITEIIATSITDLDR